MESKDPFRLKIDLHDAKTIQQLGALFYAQIKDDSEREKIINDKKYAYSLLKQSLHDPKTPPDIKLYIIDLFLRQWKNPQEIDEIKIEVENLFREDYEQNENFNPDSIIDFLDTIDKDPDIDAVERARRSDLYLLALECIKLAQAKNK
ncbi:MAG: hypothetical protein PHW50_02705 [Patescibacteria group bacterium]|nr:hypothetical protein [Patescibacteria group bacterium]